jgi:hypothetical protein
MKFIFHFLGGIGVLIQHLVFPRQVFYYLSYTSSPFHSGYFRDMVSLFAWADLDCNPPIL